MASLLVLIALLPSACSSEGPTAAPGTGGTAGADGGALDPKCNGHEELCRRQLDDGIRGLMLDMYEEDGGLFLCHVLWGLGQQPLVDGLGEIKAFLDANPGEVLSIIFENYITDAQTAGAFDATGLIDFVYAHEVGAMWPTLGEPSTPTRAWSSFKRSCRRRRSFRG